MLETLFGLSNLFVLPFWGLMIFAPGWRWTTNIMRSLLPFAALGALYAILLISQIGGAAGALLSPSAAGIAALLGTPAGATVGWIHFLAFDLFVGRWAYLDSRERGLSAWLVSPILVFVFMAGPLGLLMYLTARWIAGRRTSNA
ncbi:MAG: DUF4281 domain-containing protein [Anaerolineae bacterium]|nr:DUF4281 domain-containing protein [Anaerolineae bacterium]